jgi:hypothetical protein
MKISTLIDRILVTTICVLVFTLETVSGEDASRRNAMLESVQRKFESLFHKYYPNAGITNHQSNGVHIEYEVTSFKFPPAELTGKHENPIQRGPKKGGVQCDIYLEKGEYRGQLALFPRGNGQFRPYIIDRKAFKQLLLAPFSRKRDAHLWISLSYPPDTSETFLKEFRELATEFEKDAD